MNTALFWHRRDLRIDDNAALYKALTSGYQVQPVFIFDQTILAHLPKNDQRVLFIHQTLVSLIEEYKKYHVNLIVKYGDPKVEIPKLVDEFQIKAVFTNRDYEPSAKDRDSFLFDELKKMNCEFLGAKDQVIFEKGEVTKDDGKPYAVFTPYMRKWKEKLTDFYLKSYPVLKYIKAFSSINHKYQLPTLKEMGFESQQTVDFPSVNFDKNKVEKYHETRDIPSVDGTSRMSLHLRFGTVSIRTLAREAQQTNEKFFNELIWRDFYQMILSFFPDSVNQAFKKEYDKIEWERNMDQFQAWCEGKTGYPLVDAGMRELNETGHMHNRVRMVVASFLTKHLLLDWRLGERYFAEKLLDFELASNVGGWQWAAGCGVDAAPYFRVFNPTAQQQKFDPDFKYIKKWVPEFGTSEYIQPIVEHKFARERVLKRYKEALNPVV
jgi:deoxyribodipyrimidine photo-lyase